MFKGFVIDISENETMFEFNDFFISIPQVKEEWKLGSYVLLQDNGEIILDPSIRKLTKQDIIEINKIAEEYADFFGDNVVVNK